LNEMDGYRCGYRLSWVAWTLVAGALGNAGAQTNSLYRRADEEALARTRRGATVVQGMTQGRVSEEHASGERGRIPVLKASWFTIDEPSPKDYRVHDLITIIVNEVSRNSTKADTKAERKYTLKAALDEWFKFEGGALRARSANAVAPELDFSFDRKFKGKGDIKREDTLSARIQAEVIDVLPNGNLLLEAKHTVVVDEEVTVITLTGTCRGKDVGIDNTILSSKVADLKLTKTHQGVARDAVKRGLLTGLFDWLGLF